MQIQNSQSNSIEHQSVQYSSMTQNFNPYGNSAAQSQLENTISGSPMLSKGDNGSRVVTLQKILNKLGASLTVDGDFGLKTHRAVRIFQGSKSLSRDAIIGPITAQALNQAVQSGSNIYTTTNTNDLENIEGRPNQAPSDELKRGSAGSEVRELQALLNLHNAGLFIDGEYGPLTEAAVKRFQSSNNLEVTGVANSATIALLKTENSSSIDNTLTVESGRVTEMRDTILREAASHLGTPYSWGGNGPAVFDCSGFVLYVLREEMGLMNWGDDTAAGISNRVPGTSSPLKGDLVFYTGSNGTTHIEFYSGSGTQTLGASGGGSNTFGNDPSAKVQYGDYSRDGRRISFGSILGLIENAIKNEPRSGGAHGQHVS
jgi:peptidoglycan hydrolase-like protein with peptidoglycan-binding domain